MPKGHITQDDVRKQIEKMVLEGYTRPEIAKKMNVSLATVSMVRKDMPCNGTKNTLPPTLLKEWDRFVIGWLGIIFLPRTLWKYETADGKYYGVVMARTKKIAEKRVKDMYREWGDIVNVIITPAKGDCINQDPFPDVVEIYAE